MSGRRGALRGILVFAVVATVGAAGATTAGATVTQISAAEDWACALTGGPVVCWGNVPADPGDLPPPSGGITQMDVGYTAACGVRTDRTLSCWGDPHWTGVQPPTGTISQVSAATDTGCAVRTDSSLVCWGDNQYGEAAPPAGAFTQVAAGFYFACGIEAGGPPNAAANDVAGTVACWGANTFGEAAPPVGAFAQVSAGWLHACGVRVDGSVACWGDNSDGQASPPAGTFRQVAAGFSHTCAVRTDATVACWGANTYGESSPPAGAFSQVSAGEWYTCGLRTDGAVACWGLNDDGQLADTPAIANRPLAAATVGKPYHFQFTDGSSPPAVYEQIKPSAKKPLPPGLSMSPSGSITGTPTAVGSWTFPVKASNMLGSSQKTVTIRVQALNLISNGDFETPTVSGIQTFAAHDRIGQWRMTAGSVDIVDATFWPPATGVQSLDLNGNQAGTIQQTVTLPYAASYTLSFNLAGNTGCGDQLMQMIVSWNGVVVAEPVLDTRGHSAEDLGWQATSVTLPGPDTGRLTFGSLTPGACGPTLDSITLKQLP